MTNYMYIMDVIFSSVSYRGGGGVGTRDVILQGLDGKKVRTSAPLYVLHVQSTVGCIHVHVCIYVI